MLFSVLIELISFCGLQFIFFIILFHSSVIFSVLMKFDVSFSHLGQVSFLSSRDLMTQKFSGF